MANPTLGVMALYMERHRLEEIDYFRRLTLLGQQLNIEVIIFTPEDIHPNKKQITALQYDSQTSKWIRQLRPIPQLIYDRCRFQRTYRFPLLRKFRATYPHIHYLNHPMSHKWPVYQLLYKNASIRSYLPETAQYQQPKDLLPFLKTYDMIYLKPNDGTGGRGILCIRRLRNNQFLIQGRDKNRKIIVPHKLTATQIAPQFNSWGLKNHYLIQQGIPLMLPDGRVHDYRLLIQKNGSGQWEVTGCAGRIGPSRSITSNLHGGGKAVPVLQLLHSRFSSSTVIHQILRDMERLSKLVVYQLERRYGRLCEMALDIAVDLTGHVWLLEVNPKPAREVFRLIKETNVYEKALRRPLEYALWLHKQGQLAGGEIPRNN